MTFNVAETHYKGVPIPEVLLPNLETPEFFWWKLGVDCALDDAAWLRQCGAAE